MPDFHWYVLSVAAWFWRVVLVVLAHVPPSSTFSPPSLPPPPPLSLPLAGTDEIDAVAGHRTTFDRPESKQSLNQLLSEMDG